MDKMGHGDFMTIAETIMCGIVEADLPHAEVENPQGEFDIVWLIREELEKVYNKGVKYGRKHKGGE